MKNRLKRDRVKVITLGCSKNLVDSENLVTQLQAGHVDADHDGEITDANVVVINTCGFIEAAKEESIQNILAYADKKNNQEIDKLYVTGCLSHRYKDELKLEIPEVDAFFGTLELPALLERFEVDYRHELIGERRQFTPPHYAYLKISEGCNRTCSFCAIPLMRGKHRSKPIEQIVSEARHLVAKGVKEVILIAQELTYYGLDLYKARTLPTLLQNLCQVEGLQWIRLHYAYPSKFPRDVFHVMAGEEKICNYLDMPLQHASDRILKAMKRQITQDETKDLIAYARQIVPDIGLRTTMLVGFPDESEQDFEQLIQFIQEIEFERLGVFEYSHEEGTSAFKLTDNVPATIKSQRAQRLMQEQQGIALRKNQQLLNKVMPVLFDRKEGDFFFGRTEYDSPEVDNEVLVEASQFIRIGDFANVLIEDCTEYDLIGSIPKNVPA